MFVFTQQEPWETVEPGVERQVLGCGQGVSVARVRFLSGAVAGMHAHEGYEQSSLVERGVFDVTVAGERRRLGAGDAFFVPKGVLHDTLCVEQGVLVDTFAPGRWKR